MAQSSHTGSNPVGIAINQRVICTPNRKIASSDSFRPAPPGPAVDALGPRYQIRRHTNRPFRGGSLLTSRKQSIQRLWIGVDAGHSEASSANARPRAEGREPRAKGPSGNNCAILAADASRLAALLVGRILPVCSLLAPCDPGASAPEYVTVIVERSTKEQDVSDDASRSNLLHCWLSLTPGHRQP